MRSRLALLATALALLSGQAANGTAQLLPAGEFASRDGRPGPGKTWKLGDTQGRALAERLNAVAAKTPIAIDYEHQSMLAAANGQPAPSAGYMLGFEWRDGTGLFARVEWTERAQAFIKAGEYRYISPVILFDAKTGEITGLHNAALVSTPALLGMDAVQAALANEFPNHHRKESTMDLATLVALLGLAASASAQDVTTAIQALLSRPAVPAMLAAQLGLQSGADEAAALAALTKKLGTPDAATLQQIAALQAQVTTLQADAAARTVAELVDDAIAELKLTPAQRDWAIGLGKSDVAQLHAFVKAAPVIPGLAGQLNGRTDPKQDGADDSKAVALKAQAYQTEQAALGVHISTLQAVDHVLAKKA